VLCAVPGDLRAPFNLTMYCSRYEIYWNIILLPRPPWSGIQLCGSSATMVLAMKW
jgi:hypothetical protein